MNCKIDANAVTELYALENHFKNLPVKSKEDVGAEDCFVVVDMINGFCRTDNLKSDRCLSVAEPIKSAIDKISARKIFVCDKHTDRSEELRFFPAHCTDHLEINVVDELIGYADTAVYKNSTNAFFQFMKDIKIDSGANCVIIVGVCTDICVLQFALTMRAFFNELNYPIEVAVLTELCETFDTDGHNANLMNLMSLKLLEENGVKLYRNID